MADRAVVEGVIAEARKSGKASWYEAPQKALWEGPYRHHLAKRQRYVERVLEVYRGSRDAPLTGLDLGCGDGRNTLWLAPHFATLYASDYNLLRLERAAQLPTGARVFMADVCHYPMQENVFDVVFFNHVLEHIPDDHKALTEVLRILKPGGILILGVPNEGAAFWQWAFRFQPHMRKTSDHVHFYTAEELAETCRETGFIIQDCHPIGWGVPHWTLDALIRRWKWVDDLLEWVGQRYFSSQATSLYLILSKP